MALVERVTGPATARIGDVVTYRVTSFSPPSPSPAEVGAVRWLVKASDGAALAHLTDRGADLQLTIPPTWAGQTVVVMPYMRSPSAAVSVETAIAPAQATTAAPSGPVTVSVAREGGRYYASINQEPRFFLGTDVRYGRGVAS